MGVILQAANPSLTISYEDIPLRITNWRYIRPTSSGIHICMYNMVFSVRDITLQKIVEISNKNIKEGYEFRFNNAITICPACNGTGILDWVQKATLNERGGFTNIPYKRGRRVHAITLWNGDMLYTSASPKGLGEDYCEDCYGCGARISHLGIDHCEVVKNFGS